MTAPAAVPEAPPAVGSSPFNPRAVLAMVLFGAVVFTALLWMIGAGMTSRPENTADAHAGSKGLTGFAGLAQLLEAQGYHVTRARNETALEQQGLVILTPPHTAEGKQVAKLVKDRRYIGPTILILPKWQTMPAELMALASGGEAKKGWVALQDAESPDWGKDLEPQKLSPKIEKHSADRPSWQGLGLSGWLPDKRVQTVTAPRMVTLVRDSQGGELAGYLDDEGYYPDLAAAAEVESLGEDEHLYPVIVVAEPDLLNNWAMADRSRAMLALELISLATAGERQPVAFDLTLNGFKTAPNLLTLAFQPPFVAATFCLLLAALIAGWRAFRRYGPPLVEGRAIAFGKRALVSNSAGLVRRAGRLHLLAAPYATLVRDRLARQLSLPRHIDAAAAETAIDRALAARDPAAMPFSVAAARMRAARRPTELVRAAHTLFALERTLKR
ncbi:MAG: DUF4350 domain-containing protein [Novosphingobium sp.]